MERVLALPLDSEPLNAAVFTPGEGSGISSCPPGWSWRCPVPFEDFDLWYVASGKGWMRLGPQMFELSPGLLINLRPGDMPIAEQDPEQPLTVLYVHFNCSLSSDSCFLPVRSTLFEERSELEAMMMRLIRADEMNRRDPFARIEFQACMKLAMILAFRNRNDASRQITLTPVQLRTVRDACSRMQAANGNIDISALAGSVGYSVGYISRLVKRYTGMGVKEYRSAVRIRTAMRWLAESDMTVSEVAAALGYADSYTFSKQFKRLAGVSPQRYRHSLKARSGHYPGVSVHLESP